MTKRSEEARRKKEKLEEQLKASQPEEERVKKKEELDLGKGKGNDKGEIPEEGEDGRSFVRNLTNITDYSKRDLYNKLKEMQIALANQPGSPKEGTTFDVPKTKKTWTKGSAPQGNSESQHKTSGGEGSHSNDDDSSLSSTSSEEEDPERAAAPSG